MDRPCSETHLAMIAKDLTDWQMVAYVLGLSDAEVEEVDETYRTHELKRVKMLLKWKNKCKKDATYQRLTTTFIFLNKNRMVDRVREVLATPSCDMLSPFAEYLNTCGGAPEVGREVLVTPSPFAEYLNTWYISTPCNRDFWPPIKQEKFCKLHMVKIEIQNNSAEVHLKMPSLSGVKQRVPIELVNIFDGEFSGRKKVILIEGAPGSGKSTLLRYMSEKWASGELFQEFQLVIYISLHEFNTTQSLDSVADILPCSSDMKKSAWDEIKTNNGEGVLFLFDGWNELPMRLQKNSIFKDIIESSPKHPVERSTVVMTSRYVSSDTLLSMATSHLEILGFTDHEVKECIMDITSNDEEVTHNLLAAMELQPLLLSNCHLPLNVKIIAYLFQLGKNTLPVTLLEIFKLLILNWIQRHVRHKAPDEEDYDDIISLETLPKEQQSSFYSLCELAFNGLIEDKILFTKDDLGLISDHLSLLHGAKIYEGTGARMMYSFFHLTIQDLLAAVHMSKMPPDDQLGHFRNMFGQPKFDTVIQFYAGITSLNLAGIQTFLSDTILASSVFEMNVEDKLMMISSSTSVRATLNSMISEVFKYSKKLGDNEIKQLLKSYENEILKMFSDDDISDAEKSMMAMMTKVSETNSRAIHSRFCLQVNKNILYEKVGGI